LEQGRDKQHQTYSRFAAKKRIVIDIERLF